MPSPKNASCRKYSVPNSQSDYQFISGAGVNQVAAHPDSGIFTLNVLDSSNVSLGTAFVGPLGTSDVSANIGSSTITLSTPATLLHGQTYSLNLAVSSNSTLGNNVSVDNFTFEGTSSVYTVVPEPASLTLAVLGVIGSLVITRRRSESRLAS